MGNIWGNYYCSRKMSPMEVHFQTCLTDGRFPKNERKKVNGKGGTPPPLRTLSISSPSVRHQLVISSSSARHLLVISSPSVRHQLVISSSSARHQFVIIEKKE